MTIAALPGLLPWLAVLNGLLWLALLGIALALAMPRKRRVARRATARRAPPARAQSFQEVRPSSLSPSGVSMARSQRVFSHSLGSPGKA